MTPQERLTAQVAGILGRLKSEPPPAGEYEVTRSGLIRIEDRTREILREHFDELREAAKTMIFDGKVPALPAGVRLALEAARQARRDVAAIFVTTIERADEPEDVLTLEVFVRRPAFDASAIELGAGTGRRDEVMRAIEAEDRAHRPATLGGRLRAAWALFFPAPSPAIGRVTYSVILERLPDGTIVFLEDREPAHSTIRTRFPA